MATTYPTAIDDSASLSWAAAATDQTIQADDAVELTEAVIALETKLGKTASSLSLQKILMATGADSSEWRSLIDALPEPIPGYVLGLNEAGTALAWISPSAGAGENNTLSTDSADGVSLVEAKVGTALKIDALKSPSGSIAITKNTTDKNVELELDTANMPTVPVNKGGTGATTAAGARGNLELDQLTNSPQVQLQASTPGTAQTGHSNITGTAKAGTVVATNATIGSLNGVLKASSGVVSGSATTDNLTEGSGNLYYTNARARANRLDQMAAPAADVNMNTNKITNLVDPTAPQDAATKAYVDAQSQGLDLKASVRAASTANIADLAACSTSMDGVTLVEGDRVLLKDQSTASQNGIYILGAVTTGTAPLTRTTDANSSAKVTSGMYTFVSEGTANGSNGYVLTTADPITLNTTGLTFTQFSGAGQIVAGAGLTKTGNTLDVGAGTGITVGADSVSIDGSVATLTGSQTLSNKTLTAPAVNMGSDADGDMYYRNAGAFSRLPKGSDGTFMQVASGLPSWQSVTIPKPLYDATVDADGGADYTTLGAAFAAGKWSVRLRRGTTTETANLYNLSPGSNAIVIEGEDRTYSKVTLATDANGYLKLPTAGCTIRNLTIVIPNQALADNVTGWLHCTAGDVLIENVTFEVPNSFVASRLGAIIALKSTVVRAEIRGCSLSGINPYCQGGIIAVDGAKQVTVTRNTFVAQQNPLIVVTSTAGQSGLRIIGNHLEFTNVANFAASIISAGSLFEYVEIIGNTFSHGNLSSSNSTESCIKMASGNFVTVTGNVFRAYYPGVVVVSSTVQYLAFTGNSVYNENATASISGRILMSTISGNYFYHQGSTAAVSLSANCAYVAVSGNSFYGSGIAVDVAATQQSRIVIEGNSYRDDAAQPINDQNGTKTAITLEMGSIDVTASTGTNALNFRGYSRHRIAISANTTFSFTDWTTMTNKPDGITYELEIKQDATGSRTYAWPASVLWENGTAPTASGAGKTDFVTLRWSRALQKYLGSYRLNF